MSEKITPRIYVACLAAYNDGHLHGCWIDADQEPEVIREEVQEMLSASPIPKAEEWAIHDHEGFGGLSLSEYESFEHIAALAGFLAEQPDLGGALLEHFCGDLEEARQALDHYAGCFESLAAYAQELTEETTDIPEPLRFYIDYEAIARDMALNGDVFTIETGLDEVHVFWRC